MKTLWINTLFFTASILAHTLPLLATDTSKQEVAITKKTESIKISIKKSTPLIKRKGVEKKSYAQPLNQNKAPEQERILTKAKSKNKIEIHYPEISKLRGEEGIVSIKAFINKMGQVEKLNISKSSGYRRLDQEALRAVKSAEFSPAKLGRHAIGSDLDLKIEFRLN